MSSPERKRTEHLEQSPVSNGSIERGSGSHRRIMSPDNNDFDSEKNPYSELPDCDTNNATRIGWWKWDNDSYWPADFLPEKKKDYSRYLDRLNSGYQNGHKYQNKSYETYQLNRHLILCLGSRLRMNSWEKQRAIQLFDGLQRSSTGQLSRVVALCTCAYVLHLNNRKCHPQVAIHDRDPLFEECREDYNISNDWFESVYGQISHRIRTGEIKTQQHDSYEVDLNMGHSWRTRMSGDDDWL